MPKPKLIAVDDENDVLLIIKTALKDDFDVRVASNGPDALAMAQEDPPHCVVLDLMMPEMDGMEVLRELKGMKETAHVPVIMLTGISDRSKIRAALDGGTQYYIVKPFDCQDLINKVGQAVREAQTTT